MSAATTKERFPCSGIDGVRLKYLRFACARPEQTIEFYQALGMTLEGKLDFKKTVAYKFMYRISNPLLNDNSLALLFDVPKSIEAEAKARKDLNKPIPTIVQEDAMKDKEEDDVEVVEDTTMLFDKNCPRDYLVIYVHFLTRVLKRLQSKAHKTLVSLKTYMDIQYAILLDPNDIEVRLIEMSDVQLNELAKKSQWFARLGYYVIHALNAEDLCKYLESLFSKQKKTLGKKGAPNEVPSNSNVYNLLKATERGKKPQQADKYDKREGFRLVDFEDIITGLSHTTYRWLGHNTRDKLCALCLIERVHEQRSTVRDKEIKVLPRDTKLLSLGFEIAAPLESAVNQLQQEVSNTLFFTGTRLHVLDLGYMAQFRGLQNLTLDLYSSLDHAGGRSENLENSSQTGHGVGRRRDRNRGGPSIRVGNGPMRASKIPGKSRSNDDEQSESYINYNQKMRVAMSESSLMRNLVWSDNENDSSDDDLLMGHGITKGTTNLGTNVTISKTLAKGSMPLKHRRTSSY